MVTVSIDTAIHKGHVVIYIYAILTFPVETCCLYKARYSNKKPGVPCYNLNKRSMSKQKGNSTTSIAHNLISSDCGVTRACCVLCEATAGGSHLHTTHHASVCQLRVFTQPSSHWHL